MNESSPIRTETAREIPSAPVRTRRRSRVGRWMLVLLLLMGAGAVGHRWYEGSQTQNAGEPGAAKGKGAGGGGRHGGDQPQAVGIASITAGDIPVVLQGLGTVTPLATVTV